MKTKLVVSFSVLLVGIITAIAITIPLLHQEDERLEFMHIASDEDFMKYDLLGSGTADDPYIIESFNFGFHKEIIKDYSPLLLLKNITKHVIIRNNIFNGSHIGIQIDDVNQSSVLVENNYFISQDQCVNGICINSFYGIKISDSNYISIVNNEFQESDYDGFIYGIFFERSTNLEILDNIISSFYGIYGFESFYFTIERNYYHESVDIYFEQCSYFDVKDNIHNHLLRFTIRYSSFMNFKNNIIYGHNISFGLILEFSVAMDIRNNTFIQNKVSIILVDSHQISIIDNCFISGVSYAIELIGSSSGNLIYLNSFIENNLNATAQVQAFDDGFYNSWNNDMTQKGNFWSDLGTNLVYEIDGEAEAKDIFPLNNI